MTRKNFSKFVGCVALLITFMFDQKAHGFDDSNVMITFVNLSENKIRSVGVHVYRDDPLASIEKTLESDFAKQPESILDIYSKDGFRIKKIVITFENGAEVTHKPNIAWKPNRKIDFTLDENGLKSSDVPYPKQK